MREASARSYGGNAIVTPAQAEGLGVGDKVDLVTECGELNAQFRRDNARASVSGITRNPDAHGAFFNFDLYEKTTNRLPKRQPVA
jgi:hypothetical protein